MDKRGLLDLMIIRIPGLSAAGQLKLVKAFGEEGELTGLSKRDIEGITGRSPDRYSWTMDALRARAEGDAEAARLRGIAYVSYVSPGYPPLLRELWDPPAVLFYRGALPDPEKPLAAVVGTRRPSGAGAAAAYDMARALARGGVPVVSGLALGIDAMAHRGNLEGGGATLAVLGSGLDQIYPASNRMLARRILETGGALISEYPPGTGPQKWHFPARNRIISGLARGTLIVEAPRSSGALITAQFALDQGRDLWVASAGIASPLGEGNRKLAEEGARIVSSAGDILAEWGLPGREDGGSGPGGQEPGPGEPGCSRGAALASSLARSLNIVYED
ncbi:MAG: DNA-processing protein DprA [Treponema sp.]|nr:DNA-processing protein DprA [Treponema sp.]